MPTSSSSLPGVDSSPDYARVVSEITFHVQGETFVCRYYASNHVKVSHAALGFLVEIAKPSEVSLLSQVEGLARALLTHAPRAPEVQRARAYDNDTAGNRVPMAPSPRSALRLGCDYIEFGEYSAGRLSDFSAWAISVGADKYAPSAWAKGEQEFPNEDALLVVEQDGFALLAVADAHFGRQPSHVLLSELSACVEPIPRTMGDLTTVIGRMANREPEQDPAAATSLLVAVYNRGSRAGFGMSFADSTFALVGSSGHRTPLDERSSHFVHLCAPASLHPSGADQFVFTAEPGDLLLAYTDGINECHYHESETSVTPREMEKAYSRVGSDPEAYLRAIVELALTGVGGNPGGEDNIAAVAVKA